MLARCACGNVEVDAVGAPIISVACYCDDCQEGSRQVEALQGAPAVLDPDSGTTYTLYRKDRVRYSKGAELLKSLKIREKTDTNRVVATCCNSAMLMKFDDSKHWVPVYRARFGSNAPPLEMRICTKFKSGSGTLPTDVPSYPGFSLKFVGKLLGARIAMMFGR